MSRGSVFLDELTSGPRRSSGAIVPIVRSRFKARMI
jgi:hypothetical protein